VTELLLFSSDPLPRLLPSISPVLFLRAKMGHQTYIRITAETVARLALGAKDQSRSLQDVWSSVFHRKRGKGELALLAVIVLLVSRSLAASRMRALARSTSEELERSSTSTSTSTLKARMKQERVFDAFARSRYANDPHVHVFFV
jgi:hypothetical protein